MRLHENMRSLDAGNDAISGLVIATGLQPLAERALPANLLKKAAIWGNSASSRMVHPADRRDIVGERADTRSEGAMAEVIATTVEATSRLTRQTLTVLSADVVGYARLTEAAEEVTHTRLRSLRVSLIDPCVVSYRGRIVKNTGDGFLAVFYSAIDALQCAIELQSEISESERHAAPDRK